MARIKVLPPEVAHKIAAGEVIERPASVVKELVENSIDAGATQITIEIRDGGLESIRVQDNGVGIAKDDLKLAFETHATSKISTADDLFSLYTLGFRGEALPSIASVAKLSLYTRPLEQNNGYKIWQEQDEFKVEPIGTPPGTTVEVLDLFHNVPARLKFLKSASAERRRITELATKLALAHPHISFRLVAEGKTVLVTPGNGRLLDAILTLEGRNIGSELVKFQSEFAWGKVQGYLGSPRLAKGNRSGQIFIINGRVVQNYTLRSAVEKAYEGLLQSRTFPWAVLVLELNPKLVDCNVHPAKIEVRFAEEQTLFTDIFQAVRSGLVEKNLAPKLETPPAKATTGRREKSVLQTQLAWEPETWQHLDQVLRQYKPKSETGSKSELESAPAKEILPKTAPLVVKEDTQDVSYQEDTQGLVEVRSALRTGKILGQLHQTYILLEVPQGLWILDQHIVHERILLEELEREWETSKIHVQEILPQHLEFSPSEAALVEESLNHLASFGLELEDFGNNSFLLRAVPSSLAESGGNWKGEVLEIAESLKKTTNQKMQALITLACKGAVKAGDYLDKKVARALLNRLAETKNPFTCPHGRPIIVRLENQELLRRFGRT